MTRIFLLFIILASFNTNQAFARRGSQVEATLKQGTIIEGRKSFKQLLRKQISKQIRIFWWNIAGESFTDRPLAKVKKDNDPYWSQNGSILGNLIAHVKNDQPDIIILGEFPGSKISDYELALPSYQYTQQIPYYAGARNSITVFSRLPLVEIEQNILSIIEQWPGQISKAAKQKNQKFWRSKHITDRLFQLLQVQTDEGEFVLSPLHLVNPWPAYSAVYRNGDYPGAGALSYLAVAREQMLRGKVVKNKKGDQIYNPLQNQVRDYLYQIDALDIENEPLLLIGDFNSPSRILPYGYPKFLDRSLLVPGLGHQLLSAQFQNPFSKNIGDVETIPTKTAGKGKPKVRIDKAFHSSQLKTAAIWIYKYAGSNHYPIQLDIEL